ncbi:MAG TPA: hypothetical protein VKY54_06910, partial [Kiloniellales bacterium]|nr:hypothetical protein [Kiloniellales bacterium]
MSSFFQYRDGQLHVEDLTVASLVDEVGTPFYLYSAGAMEEAYAILRRTFGTGSRCSRLLCGQGQSA